MVDVRMRIMLGAAVFALVLAACSNGGSNGQADGQQPAGGATRSSGATVAVANGDLGEMLVDSQGRTLYLFLSDKGSTSTCEADCASTWPALTVTGQPTAGDGVDAAALGTTPRPDGGTQVTIDGHPLYLFSGDGAAGDANGQGIGGVWFVVSPDGAPIKGSAGSGGKY